VILALSIIIPCCLVGLLVYAAMSRWDLTIQPDRSPGGAGSGGGGYRPSRPSLPRLTLRETVADWPVPQFQRLHPGALIALSVALAVWVIGWIVVLFVGLGMLHG
jgi:hypothetical protein